MTAATWIPVLRQAAFACVLLLGLAAGAQVTADTDGPLQPNRDLSTGRKTLTNDTVEKMVKAGLDDSIVVQTIDTRPANFDVGPEALIELKGAGVSTAVLAAMQAKASGLPVARKGRTQGGLRAGSGRGGDDVSVSPLAPQLDEMGVYYKSKTGEWLRLKVEIVELRSGGWVKSALTHNIIKEDRNGTVDGPHSPLMLQGGVELLVFGPDGTEPEEYNFIGFREKKDRREFRIYTGGVFHNETGSDRDALVFAPHKIAPRMWTFTVPKDIGKGEYGVLPPGAANTPGLSGSGKIFTFRIPE